MLLPTMFESLEADYHHLKRHVQLWDVACQRQVSLHGADALRLVQLLCPRDMSAMALDQCYYMPMVNRRGKMLNDPVVVRLAADHFWISVADGDFWQYACGVADALDLDVAVEEPDVSPLAVQGPRAEDLMVRLFGDSARDIGFFRHRRLSFEGHRFLIARSGYSRQGGFEIYVDDSAWAMPLWEAFFAAGEDLHLRAGCPNMIERIEGGLLSFGSDMTSAHTPFEAGLGRYCTSRADFIGKAALRAAAAPRQMIRPLAIEGRIPPCDRPWPLLAAGGAGGVVGQVSSAAWSPDFRTNVALAMVAHSHWHAGTKLEVETHDGMRWATIQARFWL